MIAVTLPPTRIERFLIGIQRGIVGMLFALKQPKDSKQDPSRTVLVVFGALYDAANILSFPLHTSLGWTKIHSLVWVQNALKYRNPFVAVIAHESNLQAAVIGVILSLLSVLAGCIIYSVRGFATGAFKSVRPLQVLRASARLVIIVQVSIVERLANVFVCGSTTPGYWTSTSMACTDSLYIFLIALTVVLLTIFVGFSLTVTSVFFSRDYGARSNDGRAHGRVEIILLFMRIVLAFIFTGSVVPATVRLLAVILAGFSFFFAYARYLPEFRSWLNTFKTAVGAVFLWSSLCAIPALMLSEDSPWRIYLGYIFMVGIPGSLLLGVLTVQLRINAYSKRVITPGILRTPFDAELVARYTLFAAGIMPHIHRIRPTVIGGATIAPTPTAPPDAEAAAVIVRVRAMLDRATKTLFPGSAIMALLHADLIRGFPQLALAPGEERALLTEGLHREPQVDINFLIAGDIDMIEAREAHDVGIDRSHASSSSSSSSSSSAAVDASAIKLLALDDVHLRTIRTSLCVALLNFVASDLHLWTALCNERPNALELDVVLRKLSQSGESAAYAMEGLHRFISPRRPELKRLCGVYRLVVDRDPVRACQEFAEADADEAFLFAAERRARGDESDASGGKKRQRRNSEWRGGQSEVVTRSIARGISIAQSSNDGQTTDADSLRVVWDRWADLVSSRAFQIVEAANARLPSPLSSSPQGSQLLPVQAASFDVINMRTNTNSSSSSSDDDIDVNTDATALVGGTSSSTAVSSTLVPRSAAALRAASTLRAPKYTIVRAAILSSLAIICAVLAGGVATQIVFAFRIATATAEVTASCERGALAERIARGINNAALYSSGLLAYEERWNVNLSLAALLHDSHALYDAHTHLISPPPTNGFLPDEVFLLTGTSLGIESMKAAVSVNASSSSSVSYASLSTVLLLSLTAADTVAASDPTKVSLTDTAASYFIQRNARGALRSGLKSATNFVIKRGVLIANDANSAVVISAITLSATIFFLATVVGLLAVNYYLRTESLLAASLIVPCVNRNVLVQRAKLLLVDLNTAAGSSATFRAVLKDAELPTYEYDAAVFIADSTAVNGDDVNSAAAFKRERSSVTRLHAKYAARLRNAFYFFIPLAFYSLVALTVYYVSNYRVSVASNVLEVTGGLANVRTDTLAAGNDIRSALSDGLSQSTWSALSSARVNLSTAPACDPLTLYDINNIIAKRTIANENAFKSLAVGPRVGGGVSMLKLSPDVNDIIFSSVCSTLAKHIGDTDPLTELANDAIALGLPSLAFSHCSDTLPPLAVGGSGGLSQSPGAFNGLGADGLISLVSSHGVRLREMLPTRAKELMNGVAMCTPAALSSTTFAKIAPAAAMIDSTGWLLVDGGLKAAASIVAFRQKTVLNEILSALTTLALIIPITTLVMFSLILSPMLKRADLIQRDLSRALSVLPHESFHDPHVRSAVASALAM